MIIIQISFRTIRMNFKILISLVALGICSLNVNAANNMDVDDFIKYSDLGHTAIKNKNYDKAFEYLNKASKLGNKVSQYSLAVLYMQGYGVQQDYTQAYLWLNVASEVNDKKWRNLRDKIHNSLSMEQKAALKPHVKNYIETYGSETQDVSCYKRAATGSNRKMMTCTKRLDKHLLN